MDFFIVFFFDLGTLVLCLLVFLIGILIAGSGIFCAIIDNSWYIITIILAVVNLIVIGVCLKKKIQNDHLSKPPAKITAIALFVFAGLLRAFVSVSFSAFILKGFLMNIESTQEGNFLSIILYCFVALTDLLVSGIVFAISGGIEKLSVIMTEDYKKMLGASIFEVISSVVLFICTQFMIIMFYEGVAKEFGKIIPLLSYAFSKENCIIVNIIKLFA